jgi:hypothetical protein
VRRLIAFADANAEAIAERSLLRDPTYVPALRAA